MPLTYRAGQLKSLVWRDVAETFSAVFSGAVLHNLLDRCCFKQWPCLHLCSGMYFTRLSGVLARRELVHREEREEEKRVGEKNGQRDVERDGCEDAHVSNLGRHFQTQIRSGCKLQRGLDWYISVCSAHPLLQCNLPTRGQMQDNQLMIHLKLKLEHTSGVGWGGGVGGGVVVGIINKKISVQDSYGPIIIPSAAVLVSTGVTQSTAALPPTPGSIFYEGELSSRGSLFYVTNPFRRNRRAHKRMCSRWRCVNKFTARRAPAKNMLVYEFNKNQALFCNCNLQGREGEKQRRRGL